MEIPEALSHLNLCVSDNRVIKKIAVECVYDNLRRFRSLYQGFARPALIASWPWSALTLMSMTPLTLDCPLAN